MHLSVSEQDSALVWCLKRPDRLNALGPTLGQELLDELKKLQDEMAAWQADGAVGEPRYRCLILTAEPVVRGRELPIWIAGGDLKELQTLQEPQEGRSYAWLLAEVCSGLQDLPIPVLAVIDGLAIGGGAELALAADLRVATSRSVLHFKQLEVGLATGYGSCHRLIALVGLAKATDLLLRCRYLDSAEAARLALFNEVAAKPEELAGLVSRVLNDLQQLSPQALRVQKAMLQFPLHDSRGGLVLKELDAFEQLWMQPAHRRYLQGFTSETAGLGQDSP